MRCSKKCADSALRPKRRSTMPLVVDAILNATRSMCGWARGSVHHGRCTTRPSVCTWYFQTALAPGGDVQGPAQPVLAVEDAWLMPRSAGTGGACATEVSSSEGPAGLRGQPLGDPREDWSSPDLAPAVGRRRVAQAPSARRGRTGQRVLQQADVMVVSLSSSSLIGHGDLPARFQVWPAGRHPGGGHDAGREARRRRGASRAELRPVAVDRGSACGSTWRAAPRCRQRRARREERDDVPRPGEGHGRRALAGAEEGRRRHRFLRAPRTPHPSRRSCSRGRHRGVEVGRRPDRRGAPAAAARRRRARGVGGAAMVRPSRRRTSR